MLIEKVSIENFKSIAEMELPLGRVNVLIGANGAGKSNILEAVALGTAVASNQLSNEYLAPRGIRVPDDLRFIFGAFEPEGSNPYVAVNFERADGKSTDTLIDSVEENGFINLHNCAEDLIPLDERVRELTKLLEDSISKRRTLIVDETSADSDDWYIRAGRALTSGREIIRASEDWRQGPESLRNFLIYSPEYSKLRTFEAEGQIQPLGAGGEGLFRLLRVIAAKDSDVIDQIKEKLAVVGWFEDFVTPENDDSLERSLRIKDRYLHEDLAFFNQKSSNEGFLFLLFYYSLFLSSFTPTFFAIDNIDASLNPRLCVRLMKDIVEMAATNGKQVILTTHNPAVLDGLNLSDDQQRLFSVYRSATGETQITRILPQKDVPGTRSVPLSEAFVKGYLGGLPDTF